jgi:hypothetical protein
LLSIVYTSSASRPFEDGDLATLLMNSRANNRRLGLTGMLLHRHGQFLQVLEGPENAVIDRFTIISEDRRHARVRTLIEEPIVERAFPEWTMGYEAVTDTLARDIPGYTDFFGAVAGRGPLLEVSSLARQVIEAFRTDSLVRAG